MVIRVLVIALLVELLAIFFGSLFLERELRRHSAKAETCHAELIGKVGGLTSTLKELHRELGGVEDKRNRSRLEDSEVFERFQRELYSRVDALLTREDVSDAVKRLEALLENTHDVRGRDDEAKHSRAIEEGIANLLQYQVGKGGSSHDNGPDGF